MVRRPPRSPRTGSLVPDTTLCRSLRSAQTQAMLGQTAGRAGVPPGILSHSSVESTFDSRRTQQALAGSGIDVPDLESYAGVLWSFWEENLDDRKSTRLNSSHYCASRLPSSA